MQIIADTHVHTIASEHAFSTVMENLREAKAQGIRFLAVTDHTGLMPGAPTDTMACICFGAVKSTYWMKRERWTFRSMFWINWSGSLPLFTGF